MNAMDKTIEPQVKGPWTPDIVHKLRGLWAEGKSAGIIAGLLSRDVGSTISRSAVIGKVHRLGLSGRATTSQRRYIVQRGPDRQIRRPRKPSAPKLWDAPPDGRTNYAEAHWIEGEMPTRAPSPPKRRPRSDDAEIVPLPSGEVWAPLPGVDPVTQGDLGIRHCRWPVEDGKARFGLERLCCGAKASVDEPYCPTHANQAMPAAKRRAA